MFAPDIIPVTPEKRTPNTVKKLRGTESSNWEQSNANLRQLANTDTLEIVYKTKSLIRQISHSLI